MSSDRDQLRSYRRTLFVALAGAGAVLAVAHVGAYALEGQSSIVLAVGWLASAPFLCLSASSIVVLCRLRHQRRTGTNLFGVLNRARAEASVVEGRFDAVLRLRQRIARVLDTRAFAVGEPVEIRSYDEILRTLDADGCVDALPFMAEMKAFCGRRARVFRRVDKIYDYGRSKTLRRLDDAYLLAGFRCDGGAHGGCEAACYLLWKGCWLKRSDARARAERPPERAYSGAVHAGPDAAADGAASAAAAAPRYRCQFTELAAASSAMSPWDYRQDLRPLFSGNVTFRAFALAMLTRFFNYAQRLRRGVGYPAMPAPAIDSPPVPPRPLVPGDPVRVRSGGEIAKTLDASGRNRGLWFDMDMLNYCGRRSVVTKSVKRIIDDATGRMRIMKTPCIVLDGVNYEGEPLRFVAQEEHLYWREVWVEPISPDDTGERDALASEERPS